MTQSTAVPWLEAEQPPEKILVVDDVDEVRSLCAELIRNIGLEAATASDPSEAKILLKEESFSLTISDIAMPGMDGLKILETIFSIDPEARVILLSGYEAKGPEGIDEKISSSIKGYITKPFDLDEVIRLLSQIFKE